MTKSTALPFLPVRPAPQCHKERHRERRQKQKGERRGNYAKKRRGTVKQKTQSFTEGKALGALKLLELLNQELKECLRIDDDQ